MKEEQIKARLFEMMNRVNKITLNEGTLSHEDMLKVTGQDPNDESWKQLDGMFMHPEKYQKINNKEVLNGGLGDNKPIDDFDEIMNFDMNFFNEN